MRDLPDMIVTMDDVTHESDGTKFHWTLTGTNTGPGGTGTRVRVSGIEVWTIGSSGLVSNSIGYYDAATYERQLSHGIEE